MLIKKLPIIKYAYWLIFIILLALYFNLCFFVSEDSTDKYSDRDDAVEIASSAFLEGKNPWLEKSVLGNVLTTGPFSILIATPFVAAFKKINILSFIFWLCLLIFFFYSDLKLNNKIFLLTALLLFHMRFGYHIAFWSLEELFYPVLFLLAAYYCVKWKQFFISGALLSFCLTTRLLWIVPVFVFALYYFIESQYNFKKIFFMTLGLLSGLLLTLAPFYLILGDSFLKVNFITVIAKTVVPIIQDDINLISSFILKFSKIFNLNFSHVNVAVVLIVNTLITFLFLKKKWVSNPFLNIAIAAYTSLTILWPVAKFYKIFLRLDYLGAVMFPALFYFSLSNKTRIFKPWPEKYFRN